MMPTVLRYAIVLYAQWVRRCVTAVFLLVSVFFHPAFSQQLNFRSFSFQDGLNTYNIQKTLQDKYGFIWIATQNGLYRYDGNDFESLRKGDRQETSLQENFVFDIFYNGGDTLYAATFNGGIDA